MLEDFMTESFDNVSMGLPALTTVGVFHVNLIHLGCGAFRSHTFGRYGDQCHTRRGFGWSKKSEASLPYLRSGVVTQPYFIAYMRWRRQDHSALTALSHTQSSAPRMHSKCPVSARLPGWRSSAYAISPSKYDDCSLIGRHISNQGKVRAETQ